MHRFWKPVIQPVIEMTQPLDIVEIGADAGENTRNILSWCESSGAVLHAIDPVPKFDVEALKAQYGEQFQFHQALSLNVIPLLARFDLVLIDGDHNWYTVLNELKLLEKRCIKNGCGFPLVMLHDIDWPYARRDLYYNPDNIPGKFLKPYSKKGILPGQTELVADEGLNPHLFNSIYENDLQNGVLTAIEDFLEEARYRLEFFKIHGMNGLGIIADADFLEGNQELAAFLENFQLPPAVAGLIEMLEGERINKELAINKIKTEAKHKREEDIRQLKAARESDAQKFRQEIEKLKENNQSLKNSAAELKARADQSEKRASEYNSRLSAAENELSGLKETLRQRDQAISGYQHSLRRAEKNVAILNNWLEKLGKEIKSLLQSNRWKTGNIIGGLWQKLLFRSRQPAAVDHINEFIRQFEKWQETNKENQTRGNGQIASKVNNDQAPQASNDALKNEVCVIITVYNAFDDVRACIDSVLEKTTMPFRLILLDDCSPDERIWPLLKSYADAHGHVRAERNERNLGYTATINRGCRLAGNADVVLLNSDTIVTRKWLEKLGTCAVSVPHAATVTPLSNAAGAFSLPENNKVNDLPEFMGIDDMAGLVEKLSPRSRPQVPTGNGFCMYITRRALDQVGFFDEESFPNGYGEENDFCMRAVKKGFVNLIDDSTFIFHKRSASFKETKKDVYNNSMKRLRELHPEYKNLVSQWLKNDPLDDFRRHIQKVLKFEQSRFKKKTIKNDKPVILYILHNGKGGVHHTSFDLFEQASRHHHCFLLKTDLSKWYLYEANQDTPQLIKEYKFSDKWRIDAPLAGDRFKILKEIASICSPDIVHIRHFLANHPDMVNYFKTIGCRVIYSFHDFYTVCPTIQLVDNSGRYCEGVCSGEYGECALARNWFVSMPPLKHDFVFKWRETVGNNLKLCDAFVVTSETTQSVILKHYPFLCRDLFNVIEHGRDFSGYQICSAFPAPGEPLRVVYFGALTVNKGAELVQGMLEYIMEAGHPIEMHMLGSTNLPFRASKYKCISHGAYRREELPQKLAGIKPALAIIPSIWPETYCHTLTEAWGAGIPVLGSDLGAVGERILKNGGGWILPPAEPVQWVDNLVEIAGDKDEYERKRIEIQQMKFKTLEAMGADYLGLYKELLAGKTYGQKVSAG
ncbi:MAG: glycosyltransferase [Desulfobacterales bacterium]